MPNNYLLQYLLESLNLSECEQRKSSVVSNISFLGSVECEGREGETAGEESPHAPGRGGEGGIATPNRSFAVPLYTTSTMHDI